MPHRFRQTILLTLCIAVLAFATGCDRGDDATSGTSSSAPRSAEAPSTPPDAVELLFTYGSEKKAWITDVTDAFNAADRKTPAGKQVVVKAQPMGSGESIDEILAGRSKAHLTSPASGAFIRLGNAKSRATAGNDLIGPTKELVNSPVVIAMWRPMAEAMGWGKRPVGWADVIDLAKDPQGWARHGHSEWGRFRFGHTHPEYSNSGLISVLAEVYGGAGKTRGLSVDDLRDPNVVQFVRDVEQAVVHYGSSTGFFADKMFANGPSYLSAAVLYESDVVGSYDRQPATAFPVVAIYPREGTFWSDHPVGIVEREWVTPQHREAAKVYIDYLLAQPQQQKAMQYGFRPGDLSIAAASPIDAAHGVDPLEPKTTLEVPSADVMAGVIDLWRANKKHASVVLVFDTSGSMGQQGRIGNACAGAVQFVDMLGDEDHLSLLLFNDKVRWAGQDLPMKGERAKARSTVSMIPPDGGTALYDATAAAYDYLLANPQPDRISAIVVLTDGEDRNSRLKLEQLYDKIRADEERKPIRIFTIGYGAEANEQILKRIADETKAKFYKGTTDNIREVFKDIATFF